MERNVHGVSYRRSVVELEMADRTMTTEPPSGVVSHRKQMKTGNHSRDNNSFTSSSSSSDASTPSSRTEDGRKAPVAGSGAGLTYSWHNLNVYATSRGGILNRKKKEVHILKDVSGLCRGGQLLAIMGASGAGKTTLLNILTFRAPKLRLTGKICINGRPADPLTIAGASAYVQQLDLFTGVFTVREQLNFCAQLRIGKGMPEEERTARVEEVLKQLGLSKCSNTMIGVPGRVKGISGGEKKRLAFACELITNPMMLLCDEPTSGLDSFMAQNVMKAMKKLAESGKTVISTIHQPSSEVFAMFDRLLIMAEGRVAFLGDVQEANKFFERLERPCPENFNPGDHFIHTLAVRAGKEESCRDYVGAVCDNFRENEGRALEREVLDCSLPPGGHDPLASLHLSKSPYRATVLDQQMALLRRASYELVRDPIVTAIKLMTTMFFAVVFGSIFFDLQVTEPVGVQNVSGALFLFVNNMTFSNLFPVITIFASATPLFLREHWNGLYRTDVYFLTRNIVDLPVYILLPIIFVSVSYYMVGLRPGASYFFTHMYIMILVSNVGVSFGYMVSCMAKDQDSALILASPLIFPIMLFGGFFVKESTIPVYMKWISYLSWFKYSYECFSINQWQDLDLCTNSTSIAPCPNGNDILDYMGFDPDLFFTNIGALVALFFGFRLIAFLFLLLKTYRKN